MKWLKFLIIAAFGFCSINVFAQDQAAVSAAKAASESQPAPVQGAPADQVRVKTPINFGDYRSTTLATKAWQALAQNDIESVLAYTINVFHFMPRRRKRCRQA